MEEIIRKYFRLVNAEKFDEFFTLFADDVEFNAPFNFHVRGLESVKPFYLQVPVNYPDHTDTPEHINISGNRAAVFIDFQGRAADGAPVAFKAADWFEIENGKIKSLNIFFDSFYLLQLIGKQKP